MDFKSLGLHQELLQNLEKLGLNTPTPIQQESIPAILQKKDVAGLAQTGTGKTAAFLLPTIHRILDSIAEPQGPVAFEGWGAQSFCLILVPTRELAEQVNQNIQSFNCDGKIKSAVIIGGKEYDEQIRHIAEGVDFIVATPGRLIDLYKEKKVDLNLVRCVIFDEADRMFDMGFKEDMVYLLQRVPSDRQLLMFSATLNFDVLNVAYEFGSEPVEVNIDRDQARAENVDDQIFHVGQDEKPQFLLSLIKKINPSQGIIFSNFKRNIPKIEKFLIDNGYKTQGISSSLNQNQRQRVMGKFKEGEVQVLVATDVAARGLDIKGVDLVINFEMPDDPENYIHRIGRTGRAGEKGIAYSLVSDRDVMALNRVEDYVGNKMQVGWIEDADLIKDFKRFPYNYDGESGLDQVQRKSRGDRLQEDKPRGRKKFEKRKFDSKDGSGDRPHGRSASEGQDSSGPKRPKKFQKDFKKEYKKDFKKGPRKDSNKDLNGAATGTSGANRASVKNAKANKDYKSKNFKKKGDRYENFTTRKRTVTSSQGTKSSSGGLLSKVKKIFGL